MTSVRTRSPDCHKTTLSHGFTVKTKTIYRNTHNKVQDCSPDQDEDFVQKVAAKSRRSNLKTSYVNIIVSTSGELEVSQNIFKNLEIKSTDKSVEVEFEIQGIGVPPYQGYLDIDVFNSLDEVDYDSEDPERVSRLHWNLQPALKIKQSSRAH